MHFGTKSAFLQLFVYLEQGTTSCLLTLKIPSLYFYIALLCYSNWNSDYASLTNFSVSTVARVLGTIGCGYDSCLFTLAGEAGLWKWIYQLIASFHLFHSIYKLLHALSRATYSTFCCWFATPTLGLRPTLSSVGHTKRRRDSTGAVGQ